jgi:hypothetical protein
MLPQAEQFARMFGSFEYAMKRTRFRKKKEEPQDGKPAEADWDKIATALGAQFLAAFKQAEPHNLLLEHPARKLVIDGDSVRWDDRPLPTTTQQLIRKVCDVRNNYFHGEKNGSERDVELVLSATSVLRAVLHDFEAKPDLDDFRAFLNEAMQGP